MNGILLGHGGYGLKNYLMTSLRDPITHAQRLYNESHIRTRNTVKRQYGVWKRRFPCLSLGFRIKTTKQVIVIIACAILHNFCIRQKDCLPDEDPQMLLEEDMNTPNQEITPRSTTLREAKLKQNQLIEYFDKL
jgi:hypothetical protein